MTTTAAGDPCEDPCDDAFDDPIEDPVAALVGDLARRLRGPAALRRDLLAELSDGLEDAAADLAAAGLPAPEARALAAARFGTANDVGAACQRELAAAQARVTAVVVAVAAPSVWLLWSTWYPALAVGVDPPARHRAGALAVLPSLQAVLVWALAGAALHQLLLLRRGRGMAASAAVAALTRALVVIVAGASGTMLATDGGATLHVVASSAQGRVLGAVSAAMLLALGGLAWRTAALTRHAAFVRG